MLGTAAQLVRTRCTMQCDEQHSVHGQEAVMQGCPGRTGTYQCRIAVLSSPRWGIYTAGLRFSYYQSASFMRVLGITVTTCHDEPKAQDGLDTRHCKMSIL